LVLALTAGWTWAKPPPNRCGLALAPVVLTFERLDPATPGTPFRVRLVATARTEVTGLELTLPTPDGAAFVSGIGSWEGALARGASQTIEATFSVPDLRLFRFAGVARMRSGTAVLMRQCSFAVGNLPRALAMPGPQVTVNDRGERLMILPARVRSP
jgi:hypothetical protein